MSVDLEEKVIAALIDPDSELWFPNLTDDLAQTGWRKLKDGIGLDRSNYGTARVLLKDPGAVCKATSLILFNNSEDQRCAAIFIEALPGIIARHYKNCGVNFYDPAQISPNGTVKSEILNCLCLAFDIIKQVPSLSQTVINLVRSIHLIKPESDEYDVSFSEPHIPFSIFVSIPSKNSEINALRVAEAIIHETMHLQLTLIEKVLQLISSTESLYYSPWKEEYRTPQGILHALYVFRVIQDFFISYLATPNLSNSVINHIQNRLSEIKEQIKSVGSFKECEYLTEIAAELVKRLIVEKF